MASTPILSAPFDWEYKYSEAIFAIKCVFIACVHCVSPENVVEYDVTIAFRVENGRYVEGFSNVPSTASHDGGRKFDGAQQYVHTLLLCY